MLMLLGLLTAAWAHRPHTPVTAFAVDPDVLSSGEAWLVMESNDASQVMRSSDGGRHWDAVHTPARVDRFVGGGWGAEGPVLLAADGTLWSADATGAWASFEVGADAWALAIGPDELAVATLDGVWRAPLDDLAAGALAPTVRAARDVAWSPDGELWFLDANGGVARIGDTEARDLGATALSATADGLLAATADGVVWRDGTSWRPCGALPDGGEGDYANTPAFVGAADGGATALAATGQALYRSTDRCASWTLLPALDEVEYGTLGAAGDPSEAVIAAWVDGEHALVAGFNGVASSEAAADSFDHAVLLPEAFCRGVAFDPDYPAIPRLWVGCYGGGTRYSDDGGATWSGAGWGLTGPFVYGLAVTSAPVVPATSSSHVVHTTEDGYTWRQVEPAPLPEVSGLQASGPRLIALGTNTELEGDVRVSDDQGRSWRAIPAIEGRGGHPSWVHHAEIGGAPTIAIAYDVPAELFLSTDGGTTGRVVDAGGAVERAAGAVSWPPDSGLRWVWATAGLGVRISDDGAATWGGPPLPPAGPPHILRSADDGTLWLSDLGGQVYRSDDGAATWRPIGAPLPALIHDLVPAPQFGTSEAVIAITYGGLYAVESGRETWEPLPRHERYEDMSLYLTCTAAGGGDCPRWESRLAGNWGGWVLYPGAVLRFTAQAELVRLVGTSLDGTLAVTVDGVDRGEASMQSGDIDLGGPGWHDVVLEVLTAPDGGAELDRLTLRGAGVALTVPAGQGEGGCSGGAAWLLVSLGLWRRGRRASARAPQR